MLDTGEIEAHGATAVVAFHDHAPTEVDFGQVLLQGLSRYDVWRDGQRRGLVGSG